MGRPPSDLVARLNREIAVERLVAAHSVELRRDGARIRGVCPFHRDEGRSLVIDPKHNIWRCETGCCEGGSAVEWVQQARGVSRHRAVAELRAEFLSAEENVSEAPGALDPLDPEWSDAELLAEVVAHYQRELATSPEAKAFLQARKLDHGEMLERLGLGFSNRTLGYRLPAKVLKDGKRIRERLQQLGVFRRSGHEHMRGSLVVPVFDAEGAVVELYGRKVTKGLRQGTALHSHLHDPPRGVWNLAALQAHEEIILAKSILDGVTFWAHGFRNVTAAWGLQGFTAEHETALQHYGVRRVLLAYPRTPEGDRALKAVAQRLGSLGIESYRVTFPQGQDANAFAMTVEVPARELERALRSAEWLGSGEAPADRTPLVTVAPVHEEDEGDDDAETIEPPEAGVTVAEPAMFEPEPAPEAEHDPDAEEPAPVSPVPPAPPAEPELEVREHEVRFERGDRLYRVRGLDRNLSYNQLRVNLWVSRSGGEPSRDPRIAGFFVDTLDLYSARLRHAFTKQAAEELGVKESVVQRDLGHLMLRLEQLQEKLIERALEPEDTAVAMTETENAEALALLKDPDLPQRILEDFTTCGIVGDEANKLVGYLACVSRLLDEPLAVLIQSTSAAGKTTLMEGVLRFVPEEERVAFSAMTGQSLFYMGETELQHKVLAIAEEEGADRASYALKLLQSEGTLSIASTGKDPATGQLVSREYVVEGPVALVLTTTALDVEEDLQNRCIVLTVDEDRELTRAIHTVQRERETLAGLLQQQEKARVVQLHQNAQRLLRRVAVVNPYAPQLTFLDHTTRMRRDHKKYLGLIRAIAFLHQHQREKKVYREGGEEIEYVEATKADIALANRLAHEVFGRSLDHVPPQTRRLLVLLDEMVSERTEAQGMDRADVRFSRRDVRGFTGWGDTQLKVHLRRLQELEYVALHRGGRGLVHEFELLWDRRNESGKPQLPGLRPVEDLQEPEGMTEAGGGWAAPGRPPVGGWSG